MCLLNLKMTRSCITSKTDTVLSLTQQLNSLKVPEHRWSHVESQEPNIFWREVVGSRCIFLWLDILFFFDSWNIYLPVSSKNRCKYHAYLIKFTYLGWNFWWRHSKDRILESKNPGILWIPESPNKMTEDFRIFVGRWNTVHGRNPARVHMVNIPLFTGFHTCQVVGTGISEPLTVMIQESFRLYQLDWLRF